MKHSLFILLFATLFFIQNASGQSMELTLDQAIQIAQKSSIDMFRAKNMYRVKELNHLDFLTEMKPHLVLGLTPFNYSRSIIEEYNSEKMQYEPVEIQRLTSDYNLGINQNIGLTGGNVSVYTSLMRSQELGSENNNNLHYISTPLSITYRQNFSRINDFKWKSKVEPLKFEQAKLVLVEQSEQVAVKTVSLFFAMLSAQMEHEIALLNLENANTLLEIGKKRGKIGAISRDNLLNLELKQVNAGISVERAKNQLESSRLDFCEFLELSLETNVRCIPPDNVQLKYVNPNLAWELAAKNNPDSHGLAQRLLEVQKQLLAAKRQIYDISLEAGLGFNQNKEVLSEAFQELLDRQNLRVAINIPILDWKENRRQIQRVELNKKLTEREIQKTKEQLTIEVIKKVNDFNIKQGELNSAAKADSISRSAYEATQELFSLGKTDVLSINESYRSMYAARNQYLNALRNYWYFYYTIRQLCLYDFETGKNLSAEFESLLETDI